MAGNESSTEVSQKRAGAPRWMWTFADLMSLLFALFVLLLTFADFDPRKFDDTMGPVRSTFKSEAGDSKIDSAFDQGSGVLPSSRPTVNVTDDELEKLLEQDRRDALKTAMIKNLKRNLNTELKTGAINLEETVSGVVMRFPSSTAFETGGAYLSAAIGEPLDRIARVLGTVPGTIPVSGHTDDIPISTDRFRSNWDLSTARAVSVVHFLVEHGIKPERVAAIGYAETKPLAPNATPEGRALNRRVQIEVTISPKPVRH